MSIFLTTILSALAPAGVEVVKELASGIGRRIGGLSVDDEIKLRSADVQRLQALATLDQVVGTPKQWVVDLRASFRYIACAVFIFGGLLIALDGDVALRPLGIEMATSASAFIFGERMLLSLRNNK